MYLTILMLCLSTLSSTRCADYGIDVYSSNGEITSESIIVVEGVTRSQRVIESLNVDYPIYLVSGDDRVELKIIEKCKGTAGKSQALLKPVNKLKIGETYELRIDNVTKYEIFPIYKRRNARSSEKDWISWKVNSLLDRQRPYWEQKPELIGKDMVSYGCGPSKYLIFNTRFKDDSPVLVKTELVDLQTKKSCIYYIDSKDIGQLKVGHGMCSGAFRFEKDKKYKIRFRLMDMTGNLSKEWTKWTEFDSVFKSR